jgi:hypothetical protein
MLEPAEIGEVLFTPEDGDRLRIEIADVEPYTFWTVEGARAAIAYLQTWVGVQEAP